MLSCLGLPGKIWQSPLSWSLIWLSPSPPVLYTEIPALHPLHPISAGHNAVHLFGGLRCSWWENCLWSGSSCCHSTSAGDLMTWCLDSWSPEKKVLWAHTDYSRFSQDRHTESANREPMCFQLATHCLLKAQGDRQLLVIIRSGITSKLGNHTVLSW